MVRLLLIVMFASRCFATVPDESVLPEWSKTFKAILAAQRADFRSLPKLTGSLTDDELLGNQKDEAFPESLKLSGADECSIKKDDGVYPRYECTFLLPGKSSAEADGEFLRLVHLVEKAVGGIDQGVVTEQVRKPDITDTSVGRRVMLFPDRSGKLIVFVGEWWLAHDSVDSRVAPSLRRSRLHIEIPGISAYRATERETDSSERSGNYSPLPRAVKTGSTGVGPSSIRITNGTPYTLQLTYEGSATQSVRISAGDSETVSLPAGSYRVNGSVSAPNVLPFRGTEDYGAGDQMEVKFYIR